MDFSVELFPKVDKRPCRFCLCLQAGSVFADFDLDPDGHVVLLRISFDGYGMCSGPYERMPLDDSRVLTEAIEKQELDDPRIKGILCRYFGQNTHAIWSDALAENELL